MKYLYVYPELCTGCRECSLICSLSKFEECNPKKSAISIVRDELERFECPIICMQCEDAPCLKYCPQNAYCLENGVIKYDSTKCIKCRFCATICPYGAITVLNNDIVKCDLCNGDPKCVKVCSTNAIRYEEETQELAERRKGLAKKLLQK
ncbi:MAG: 4Fe-4S dicluster domain-containing protein [Planctomycetota bacterium]|nr:4Fe-4S dicluster domain-containing protein [Planctomycetota bacterium]MDI6788514.1 4Fe-4S dicluster domain-containing protein [Planctomycetota bacterium]